MTMSSRALSSVVVGLLSVVTVASSSGQHAAQGPPAASQPVTAEEASYRANVAIANVLLDELPDDEVFQIARHYRRQGDFDRAAVYGLVALRGKPGDPMIEYELACNFALWGQKRFAMKYVERAADHGYWGYRIIADDTDLDAIKDDHDFAAVLEKVKASFEREAPKHAPGATVERPKGDAPEKGWPAMVTLHGWGSSRHDFDDAAALVASLGYVGISLDANEVMGPRAYTWTDSTVRTHERIQAALAGAGVKVDPSRVYLHGFSQGAMHAACLLAERPGSYAGAIANSPGPLKMMPEKLADAATTGGLVLSIGSHEHTSTVKAVDGFAKLWADAKRPVRVLRFEGGHQLPPDAGAMFRESLKGLSEGKLD